MENLQTHMRELSILAWQRRVLKAIERGDHISLIEPLLQKGDVNFMSPDEYSPLLYACKYDRVDIVQLLIQLGADVNAIDALKETALYRAAQKGWLQVAESLVSKGADVNFTGPFGQTPLFAASVFNKLDVLRFLIDSGADPNIHTKWHGTALHLATKMGRLMTVKILVDGGADVNSPCDPLRIPPLHTTKDPDVAEVLIRAGADCNNVNLGYNRSPFSRFIFNRASVHLVALCIEYGAYVDTEDYVTMSLKPEFEQGILQNSKLCALAVANRFNYIDLRNLYKLLDKIGKTLPNVDKLKIARGSKVLEDIELTAKKEIEAHGRCNVWKMQPIALSMLCIKPLIDYYSAPPKKKKKVKEIHFEKMVLRSSKRPATPKVPTTRKSRRLK